MEKAQEWGVSALICSWDVKRAFDSVSRTAIRMALNQLGVPWNVLNMVHEMEVEGITIVRTPLTQYIYDQEGMEGLRTIPGNPHTSGKRSTPRGYRKSADMACGI